MTYDASSNANREATSAMPTDLESIETATLRAVEKTSFAPSPDNARAFRNALGQFGTGVTIITIDTPDGPFGMTANSFASVSLDPALVLWSLAKSSGRLPAFIAAENYAIHVLSSAQKDLALAFAKSPTAFDCCDWQNNQHDVPLIDNGLARFECRQSAIHDAGDHFIIVGQVEEVTLGSGEPLIFAKGGFGGFSDS